MSTLPAQRYNEPFRPQFHYSAPQSWLNDPNGLVYYEGEYHLFYQYHPDGVIWGPMHWGHAVSIDLIHWETLPIALYPDEHGTIFSGTVVVDADNTSGLVPGGGLVAIYSYNTQTQGAAFSTDRGRTWTKYDGNPILPALRHDFRDPKVFWHDGQWTMIIAAGQSIMLLTSPDLLHWEAVSEVQGGFPGAVWEVPDLFPLTVDGVMKWVLIVSINPGAPAGGGGTRYFIGSFDGHTFTDDYPDQTLWFDWGADNYAGTTFNDVPDGRRFFIGWMSNWAYAERTPTSVWRGAMTIPRELSLVTTAYGIRLVQRPVDSLRELLSPLGAWENMPLDGVFSLGVLSGQTLDLELEVELGSVQQVGVVIGNEADSAVQVAYDVRTRRLVLSRPQGGIDRFTPEFYAPLEPVDGRIKLRLLVDHSSVEAFANDGIVTMTAQVFPADSVAQGRLFARGGSARVAVLRVYQVESIWDP